MTTYINIFFWIIVQCIFDDHINNLNRGLRVIIILERRKRRALGGGYVFWGYRIWLHSIQAFLKIFFITNRVIAVWKFCGGMNYRGGGEVKFLHWKRFHWTKQNSLYDWCVVRWWHSNNNITCIKRNIQNNNSNSSIKGHLYNIFWYTRIFHLIRRIIISYIFI